MTHILLLQRMTKWSHAYYHDGLTVCCPQPARILLPASLKMRMLLFRMWQVNTHNPHSGHCHPYPRRRVVHTFTGDPTGKSSEARHITRDSSPLCVLLLFFAQISTLFVVETNRYYQDYFDSITDMKSSPKPDVTEAEMFVFLTLTFTTRQTGGLLDKTGATSRSFLQQNDETRQIFTHPSVLHFTDNKKGMDRTDDSYDRLWKIRGLFETLKAHFSKFYNPSKHLAVDEVIVKFKERVIFKQYIPTKRKHFGIKMYKLCDSSG